jgi:hypothetical protein
MMADIAITCPDCGTETGYSWTELVAQSLAQTGANRGANLAQISDTGANAEIAHGSKDFSSRASSKKSVSYNKGYDQGFLVFWDVYPLKRGKRKAQNAWLKAVRRISWEPGANMSTAMAQILAGAVRYRDDPNRVDEFTKYAEGWLNGDGWEDEPLPQRLNGKAPTKPVAYHMPFCTDCREAHPPGQHVGVSR